MIKAALVGNPNSGKTTIFNHLSDSSERIGNWAGVTVERKEAPLHCHFDCKNETIFISDLPGSYSMTSVTLDEDVTIQYLKSRHIDVIVNVIDVVSFERSLEFTLQLLEHNIPMVVVINKMDMAKKNKMDLDPELLASMLNVPVICTQANKKIGLQAIVDAIVHQKYHCLEQCVGEAV